VADARPDRANLGDTLREQVREIGIPRLLIGVFLVALFGVAVALLLLARALVAALSGNLEAVFEAIGSKSAVAEAKEEIAAVEQAFEAERKQ
jgi:hypothetical protein